MSEQTVHIDLPVILPGISHPTETRAQMLETAFTGKKGVLKAHLESIDSNHILCLHYDPDLISLESLQQTAIRTGIKLTNRIQKVTMDIEGMDCADCGIVIQHSVSRLDGVLSAHLNYPLKKLRVEVDTHKVSRDAIEKRIQLLGYRVPDAGSHSWFSQNRELIFSLSSGILLVIGWLLKLFSILPQSIHNGFFIAAYLFGGWDIARHAIGSIREKQFDTDLLMILAALGAAALGNFAEGALLIFLFSLGHSLEERALEKARKAIYAMQDLTPRTARVRRMNKEFDLNVEELEINDTVVIKPGIRIPADGDIISGSSYINQAPITGESLPVARKEGDLVFAGSVNGDGSFEMSVTRLAEDSTISRIIKMVEDAQTHRSPTQAIVEKFSTVYVPLVLIITTLAIFLPLIWSVPFQTSFIRAMTFLVGASPCALALGTPSAILAGIARAAQIGIIIKGGIHLENLGTVKAVALDKTGTITTGYHTIANVISTSTLDTEGILQILGLLESRSAHPLAKAISASMQLSESGLQSISDLESYSGLGIKGIINRKVYWAGNLKLLEDLNIQIKTAEHVQIQKLQSEGKTVVLLADKDHLLGLVALADTQRPTAQYAIQKLKTIGIREIALLTGDNRTVGEAIGNAIGATTIHTDLLPEDKLKIVQQIEQDFGPVAMVGDGINDAPALVNATVGIAMGGAGTDVALESSDVVLMANDISRLPSALIIGRSSRRVIIQNLIIALGVIVLLGFTSLTGLISIGLAVLLHEGSTLVVVLNSLRLLQTRA